MDERRYSVVSGSLSCFVFGLSPWEAALSAARMYPEETWGTLVMVSAGSDEAEWIFTEAVFTEVTREKYA